MLKKRLTQSCVGKWSPRDTRLWNDLCSLLFPAAQLCSAIIERTAICTTGPHRRQKRTKPALGLKSSFALQNQRASWMMPAFCCAILINQHDWCLITSHPERKQKCVDFLWTWIALVSHISALFLKQSALSGSRGASSSGPGLFVNITDTLFIGNLFHTLFLSLPKVESSCSKYDVRQPSPAGGKGGEQKEIIGDACRILKIHYLRPAWFNKNAGVTEY